ncbi:hypothetical protein [Sphingomonas humi]|uniref:DUF4345 domain-containing protein n=1 Tax=Sphingomonas humi TaxID=335630 RepID=A0ABP7SB04_9SPHN
MRVLRAAAAYAAAAFAFGFLLGTIRALLVVPRLGDVRAAMLEVWIMLAASWRICGWCMERLGVSPKRKVRVAVGALAFLFLIAFEAILGVLLLGRSASEQLQSFTAPAGLIGLGAQLLFAAMPTLHAARDERRKRGGRGRD